uniref:Uncharacterized protein n=1 Tax=Arundo donax TaxID=35708 RepID=A0A0A9HQB0_ARUDO
MKRSQQGEKTWKEAIKYLKTKNRRY